MSRHVRLLLLLSSTLLMMMRMPGFFGFLLPPKNIPVGGLDNLPLCVKKCVFICLYTLLRTKCPQKDSMICQFHKHCEDIWMVPQGNCFLLFFFTKIRKNKTARKGSFSFLSLRLGLDLGAIIKH